jgi:hypothetical protein
MSPHIRVWRLRNRYRWLVQRIREELKRRTPDARVVEDLKRRKRQVKHELALAEADPA